MLWYKYKYFKQKPSIEDALSKILKFIIPNYYLIYYHLALQLSNDLLINPYTNTNNSASDAVLGLNLFSNSFKAYSPF